MSQPALGRPGVFLDRDGTLIDALGYLGDPASVRLYPGAAQAVRALNAARLPVVLATNQSGVARGLFSDDDVRAVHARVAGELAAAGAALDLVVYCPHHPSAGAPPYRRRCDCRKPEPGMLLSAAAELGLDLARSFAVGDAERDLEAAHRAGIRELVLVATGKGAAAHARLLEKPPAWRHRFVEDLESAVEWILARAAQGR